MWSVGKVCGGGLRFPRGDTAKMLAAETSGTVRNGAEPHAASPGGGPPVVDVGPLFLSPQAAAHERGDDRSRRDGPGVAEEHRRLSI